ncbi:MAG: phage major capsid protein, partial [Candidatus Heimdallarchaeota archaeon]
MENIQNEIKNLATEIDVKLEKLNNQIKESGQGSEDLKTELKNMSEKSTTLQEKLEKLETKLARPNGNGGNNKFDFRKALKDVLLTDEYKNALASKSTFEIMDKLKVDMTRSTAYDSEVLESWYKPGVIFDPDRPQHVRQIVATGSIDSYNLRFRQEDSYNDGTSTVVEGVTKPQTDFNIGLTNRPVEKIASYIRVSDEMMADANFVSSYISARMPKKVLVEEDAQVLYGDGISPNLHGLTKDAAAYVTLGLTDANKNRYDILRWSIKNVNQFHYM